MKIQRLLIILFYLSTHERVRIEELCTLLEVSQRTAYRDLEILRTAGVEIESYTGMKGGISLSKDFSITQLLLDKDEWKTLAYNSLCMGQFNETQFSKEANDLYKKLLVFFNTESISKQKKILLDLNYKFQDDDRNRKLKWFEDVIDQGFLINNNYESPFCDHMSTDGYVAPYGLVNKVGFWYLVGFCHSHDIYRAFNLSYIKNHEMTNIQFEEDKDFDLEEFWRKSNPR